MANPRGRLARIGRKAARWFGYALLSIVGLIILLFACINLKPMREFIRARANAALSTAFVGTLSIERIGYISPYSLGGVDAVMTDAGGRKVIVSRGLSATCRWPSIVWDLVRKRPLTITLEPVRSDHIELVMIDDGTGSPTFASAFNPREPAPKEEPPSTEPPPTIRIPHLDARHIWVHGGLEALPSIDTELSSLLASLRSHGSELDLKLEGVRVLARNLPARVDPRGKFVGHLSLRGERETKFNASADFDGTLAGAKAKLYAALDDKKLHAKLSAPDIAPSVVSAQLPGVTPRGASRLEVAAHGELPRITFEGALNNPAAEVRLTGHVALEETLTASAALHAEHIDASGFVPTAPPTRLALEAKVDAKVPKDGPTTAEYEVQVPVGLAQGIPTPALNVSGKLVQTKQTGLNVEGALRADERGAKLLAHYRFTQDTENRQAVDAGFSLELSDPPRLRQLTGVSTNGNIQANAKLDLSAQRIVEARATAALAPVAHAPDRIASLNALVNARGALNAPTLDVRVQATRGVVSGQKFQKLDVSGAGTLKRFAVRGALEREDVPRLEFETALSSGKATELISTLVLLKPRDGEPIQLRAQNVSFGADQVRVGKVELNGAGSLALSGNYQRGRAEATFEINELDVARVTRALGVRTPIQQSIVSAKGHVKGPLARLQGKVEAHVRKIDVQQIRGGSVDVDLSIENQIASGSIDAKLGDSRIAAKLEDVLVPPPGAQFSPASLQGKLAVNGSVELKRFVSMLRDAGAPLESADGRLELQLDAEKPAERRGLPTALLRVKTKALKVVEQRPREKDFENAAEARVTQPRALDGVDIDAELSLDPERNRATLAGSLFDKLGPMLELDAETRLPHDGMPSPQELQRTSIKMSARVPARELAKLPRTFRPPSMHGVVQASVEAEGTVREPKLLASAAVRGFRTREGGRRALSAEMMVRYDKQRGELRAAASTKRQPNALFMSTSWDGDLIGKIANPNAPLDLDAEVKLDKFPVALVPVLSDRALRGPVSCNIKLEDLGKNAKLNGMLDGSGLKLGGVQLSKLDVTFKTEKNQLLARLDAQEQKGSLQVDVTTPVTWGQALAPTVDPHVKAKLLARRFQLETISPFLAEYVSTLEGELNADMNVEVGQEAPKVQGSAELREGVVQIPQIGQRFSDVTAKLRVDEAGRVKLEQLQARGTSGRITASAEAALRGTELQSAKAQARITKSEKLPVTFEGVALGDAWGNINVTYRKTDGNSEIRVDVPKFQMEMPETGFGNVQGLDPDEHVKVGVYRSDGSFAPLPLQPLRSAPSDAPPEEPATTTKLHVHLGDSVWIERGTQARVQLTGDLDIISGEESKILGRIELRGGRLDVNGKTFNIESGVVSFDGGDPGNPTITATARWDAPDSYAVYAEYAGTVKAGKLTLHSEPPLTQPEIVSLLLFGSPEGSLGSSSGGGGGAAATAVGVAGDTAVRGFNRVMSDFTHLDVSARIDTSTGSARPELVVQVTPRLTTRVTRALGEPPPGQSPDRTFLTLELRLQRSWAVSAIVGDRGASVLDLIWRKRY
ncbi:MAG: translocation/assembly module TamB domain-containing protein [Myxococcota bacterium]